MSEQKCTSNVELHAEAVKMATKFGEEHNLTLLAAMDPTKMTPAEVMMVETYLDMNREL